MGTAEGSFRVKITVATKGPYAGDCAAVVAARLAALLGSECNAEVYLSDGERIRLVLDGTFIAEPVRARLASVMADPALRGWHLT